MRSVALILCFALGLSWGGSSLAKDPSVEQAEKGVITPSDVYSKVQSLNQGLVLLLRQHTRHLSELELDARLFSNPISPRHVYQRVLDVEHKLVTLMRLNSLDAEMTNRVEIRNYEPAQVFGLVEKVAAVVYKFLAANQIQEPEERSITRDKQPEDVFHLLARMEGLMLKMGAPSTQLHHFMRRAQALSQVAYRLCDAPQCYEVTRGEIAPEVILTPVDIYVEIYHFIKAMDGLVQRRKLEIRGGIVALPARQNVVSPSDINSLLGVALADLVAISDRLGLFKTLRLEPFQIYVGPKEIWTEINYARRVLEALSKS